MPKSRATSARVNTTGAHGTFTKPCPPSKRASTAVPFDAASARGRSRKNILTEALTPDRTLAAGVARCRGHSRGGAEASAGDQQHPGSLCSNTVEQRKSGSSCGEGKAALAPAGFVSLDKVETFGHPSNTETSLHGSTGERCSSEKSFDVYDGEDGDFGASESGSTASSRSSSMSDFEAPPQQYPVSDDGLFDQRKAGTEKNRGGGLEKEERGKAGDVLDRITPAEENVRKASRRSRRHRRNGETRGKRLPEEGSTCLDDAWPNRWLTGKEVLVRCREICWQNGIFA